MTGLISMALYFVGRFRVSLIRPERKKTARGLTLLFKTDKPFRRKLHCCKNGVNRLKIVVVYGVTFPPKIQVLFFNVQASFSNVMLTIKI